MRRWCDPVGGDLSDTDAKKVHSNKIIHVGHCFIL